MEDIKHPCDVEMPIGYVLYCLLRSITTDLSRLFIKHNVEITVEQYRTLFVISRYPGNTQQWLSNSLIVDKSSLSRIVDTLVSKGCVTREKVRGSGNQYAVYPTEKGSALAEHCYALSADMTSGMIDSLSAAELQTLREMVVRMLDTGGRDLPCKVNTRKCELVD